MGLIKHINLPVGDFKFNFAKKETKVKKHKAINILLYCLAKKDENNNWKAYINTKGISDYNDVTILDFTEESFILKNRIDVFLHEKDKYNHYVRIIRQDADAFLFPGDPRVVYTLCHNCVFSGHIIKVNGVLMFDMKEYIGTRIANINLLEQPVKIRKKDEQ